jgi:DNA modification methylase
MWVSGTSHVIHSVGFAMQQLGFKLLNDISWVKPQSSSQSFLPLLHPRH